MNSMTKMKSKGDGFTDVDGVIAVDEAVPSAGAIVWWRLSGTVDFDTMRDAWLEAGLDEKDLLQPCSPTVALRRAVIELREKRRLVRPLGKGNGFAIVKERVIEEKKELDHEVLCKITLNKVGHVEVETIGASNDEVKKIAKEVRETFDRQLNTLDTTDFSHWFVRMMPRLDAVGLREGGGVYFVPHGAVERVRTVVSVLRKVSSHLLHRVPAMRSDDAVEAILDAITQEATAEAESLERTLDEMKLGEKGFENRITHCDKIEGKVARYEVLLGRKLDDVRGRLEDLRARLSLAVLKTQGMETSDGASLSDL